MKFHFIAKAALALSFLAAPCVAQTPRAAQDHFNRGESLYQKGDFEGAIADFTKAIEISSRLDNRDWKGDAGFAGARSNFDKVRVLDPLAAAAYANRGLARYQLRDYEGAIADCDRAIAIYPRLPMAYNNRGIVRYAMKDYDRALVDLDRAIAINPRDADIYNNRGNVYMDKEDIDRALADFDRAVALDPRRKEIYFNRGFARRRKGDHDGASKDFDKALALDPRFASGHYGRAVVMFDKSEFVCGKIFQLSPNGSGGFTASEFVTGLGNGSAVTLIFGPHQNTQALYYITFAGGGQVRRISFVAN